jgi:hypothetical protein
MITRAASYYGYSTRIGAGCHLLGEQAVDRILSVVPHFLFCQFWLVPVKSNQSPWVAPIDAIPQV